MLTKYGKEVRKLRIDEGIRTKEMADALDVTPSYLSAMETGKKPLTDNFVNKAIQFFASKNIDASHLKQAAELSKDKITKHVEKNEDRALVAAFARKFSGLSDEEKKKLEAMMLDKH